MATDDFSAARNLSKKLASFKTSIDEEIKRSPEQIRQKYADKRREAIVAASDGVRAMLLANGTITAEEVKAAKGEPPPPDPEQPESAAKAKAR